MRFLFLLVTIGSIVSAVAVVFFHQELASFGGPLKHLEYFESGKPSVVYSLGKPGIGVEKSTLEVTVSDDIMGIDELVIRATQSGKEYDIFKKSYPEKVLRDQIKVTLDGEKIGLAEGRGTATIQISTFDSSFNSNAAKVSFAVDVDYDRPEVEVLTTQHNGAVGGVQLLLYSLRDSDSKTVSGVEFGSRFYHGAPASFIDSAFASRPEVYFVFFGFPLEERDGERPRLIATDSVGNEGSASLSYRMRKRKWRAAKIALEEPFIEDKVTPLLRDMKVEGISSLSLQERFRMVNDGYRKESNNRVRELLKRNFTEKQWEGAFDRMSGGATQSSFGDRRTYFFHDEQIGGSLHEGIDLAANARSAVKAASDGKVLFAEDLGVYGKTVIIDHGAGVATLYGHLSDVSVRADENVARGDKLGNSGSSGLAGGDHLHFEVRVDGEPVHPIEWWDSRWIKDHVTSKIADVKSFLGVGRVLN